MLDGRLRARRHFLAGRGELKRAAATAAWGRSCRRRRQPSIVPLFSWEPVMRLTNRILFSLAVAGMALFVAAASAQDKKGRGFGGRGGGGFGNDLPTLAANEAVQKDLGLSSDSASKFTSLRDDYRAASQKERQNANINFQD